MFPSHGLIAGPEQQVIPFAQRHMTVHVLELISVSACMMRGFLQRLSAVGLADPAVCLDRRPAYPAKRKTKHISLFVQRAPWITFFSYFFSIFV